MHRIRLLAAAAAILPGSAFGSSLGGGSLPAASATGASLTQAQAAQAYVAINNGDASSTMVKPSYSSIGQTQKQAASYVYDLSFDGAKGDATSDNAALNRAIAYARAHPGTVIHLPAGTWAFSVPNGQAGFALPNSTIFEGTSRAGTIITWNDNLADTAGQGFALFGGYNNPGADNVTFRDFTIRGQEDKVASGASAPMGEAANGGYPFLMQGYTNLVFDNVAATHSRKMSIVVRYSSDVTVTNCLVQYSSRDGISIGSTPNVTITNNVVEHDGDDSIAVHSQPGESWGARRNLVIVGNRIFDGQGILALGARNATISGNVIDNVRQLGINVQTEGVNGSEGTVATNDVLITNNIITNVYSRQNVDGLNSGADYILVSADSARAGGYTGVPGVPGSDGVTHSPYFEAKANSPTSTVAIPATQGIVISGNIIGRTIPPTNGTDSRYKTWTDLGFGPIWVQTKENVSPSLSMKDLAGTGVHLYNGSLRGVHVSDNQFIGLYSAMNLDAADHYDDIEFVDNTVTDVGGWGFLINSPNRGTVKIEGNTFDLDPYFVSSSRGSHGTWANPYGPVALYVPQTTNVAVTFRNNIVRNAGGDSNIDTSAAPSNYLFKDNIVEADPNSIGNYDSANKGVGQVRLTGGFHLVQMDSDPTSATYGQMLTPGAEDGSQGMPTAGKWAQGQFVNNLSASASSPYAGFMRATSGTGAVLGTDWYAVPALVGGNFRIPAGGKVMLDNAGNTWVQEVGGKVVIGATVNGTDTRLFSIDPATGNVVAKGTITQAGTP